MSIEGVIINFIFGVFRKIRNAYANSTAARVLKRLGEWIRLFIAGSSILSLIGRRDFFSRTWEHSGLFRLFDWLLNAPSLLCARGYKKVEGIFSDSQVFKLLKNILSRFEVLIGVALIIMLVIPDARWHNMYSTIMIILLAILFFIKTVIDNYDKFDLKVFDFALVVFVLSIVLSAATSLFPGASLNYLIFYAVGFLLVLIIVSSVKTGNRLNILVEILIVGVAVTGLYGLWQWKVVGVPVNPALTDVKLNQGMFGRIFSTMGNANVYGELLILTMPFFWAIVMNSKTAAKKLLFGLFFVPVFISLFLTGSRSAWVSFAISVFIFVFFKNRRFIPLLLIAGAICIPFLPDSIYRRIVTLFNPNDTSAGYRQSIFESVTPMLNDYWVTGVGLGTDSFSIIFNRYMSYKLQTVAHTHNLYLQVWLESGLIAIVSFIWFIFRIFKNSIIGIFGKADVKIGNILIAGIASISGILVMGMADYVWFFNRIMLIFWVDIGIILAGLGILASRKDILRQTGM